VTIIHNKKASTVSLEAKSGVAVWVKSTISNPGDILSLNLDGIDMVFVPYSTFDATDMKSIEAWNDVAEKLIKKQTLLIYTPGEYRMKDLHVRGISDETAAQYYIETSEGSVGLFTGVPSTNFIKKYAPIDVIIGEGDVLSASQLDLEPFFVVVTGKLDEYKQKSGVSEIKETDKVSIRKIDQTERDSSINLTVVALT
jgi:hypothetical protein